MAVILSNHGEGVFRDISNFTGFQQTPALTKFVLDHQVGLNLLHSHGEAYTDLVYYDDFNRSRPMDNNASGTRLKPCSWYFDERGQLVAYEWTESDVADNTLIKLTSELETFSHNLRQLELQHSVRFGITGRPLKPTDEGVVFCEYDDPDVVDGHVFHEEKCVESDLSDPSMIPTTFGCAIETDGVISHACRVTSHYCRDWYGDHIKNSVHSKVQ